MQKKNKSVGVPPEAGSSGLAAAQLAALIESTQDLIWAVDLDYRLITFNRAMQQNILNTFGVRLEVGMRFHEVLPPERAARWPGFYERVLAEGPFRVEYSRIDGGIMELAFNPIVVNGKTTGISIFGKEVTEQKKSENALKKSEANLSALIESTQDLVWSVDLDNHLTQFNQAFEQAFLVSFGIQVVRGMSREGLLPPEKAALSPPLYKRALSEGPFHVDYTLRDGRTLELSFNPTLVDGKATGVSVFGKDITERKAAEENRALLASVVDSSGDLIHAVNLDGTIASWNPGAERITGYKSEEILGKHVASLALPDQEEHARQNLKIIRDGRAVGPFDLVIRRKDGTGIDVSLVLTPIRNSEGKVVGASAIARDITPRKQSEQALQKAEKKYRDIFEGAMEGLCQATPEGRILAANPSMARMLGYDSPEEFISITTDLARDVWVNPDERMQYLRRLEEHGFVRGFECQFKRKDGRIIWVSLNDRRVCGADGSLLYLEGFMEDITERKAAEERLAAAQETLRSSEERYRTAFQTHIDAINITRLDDGTIIDCNQSFLDIVGFKREEVIGRTSLELRVWANARDRQAMVEMLHQDSSFRGSEFQFQKKSGEVFWGEMSASVMEINGIPCVLSITRDLSAAKAAEESLRKAEQKYREIFEDAPEGIFQIEPGGRLITVNPAGVKLLGYESFEEMRSLMGDSTSSIWQNSKDWLRSIALVEGLGIMRNFQCQLKCKDGMLVWVSLAARAIRGQDGKTLFYQGFIEDITKRKQLESSLKTELRENKLLSDINAALLRAKTEEELLSEYCRIIVETGGYRMAWVGFAENSPNKPIVPVAHYGHEDGYLKTLNVTWADTKRGQGPTGRAIRSGIVQVSEDIAADPLLAPWHAEALKRGYRSMITLPFRYSDEGIACLTAYGEASIVWSESERKLMQQIAQDLGFGITTLRTGILETQHLEDLKVSLEETIQVIADTVDQRDPYTAGHQRRVADLCINIANKIGLSENRTHGLRLAAIIHDLGKIAIPAELLSKPGRLSTPEFNLIKEHPRLGYEIIKHVTFPWPIGDIILQHHERLDGSGYPQGLKTDEILLESKILAVADEVEARSSHRPYRPSKGIDDSIDNILARRGTHFDLEVVDACAKLFREDGYKFPD
jgi:PAS domain S-box-containing protein